MKTKRTLSFLLVLCMMLSLVTVPAFATDETEGEEPAHAHIWEDSGVIITAASCKAEGVMGTVCSCGETSSRAIPLADHILGETPLSTTDADCTHCSTASYSCTVCNATVTIDTDVALGHNMEESIVTAPTCTTVGLLQRSCTRCSHTENENIPVTAHPWGEGTVTKAPSCTETGVLSYSCTACGAPGSESIPMTEHPWNSGEVTKEPTCEDAGVITYTCTVCGTTTSGSIDALGHDLDAGVVDKPATCKAKGTLLRTCNTCGDTQKEDIAVVEHDWDEGVIKTPATCSYEGSRRYTCKGCGDTKDEDIEPFGHKLETIEVKKEATCTQAGKLLCECTNCKEQKDVFPDALGHDFVEDTVLKEATADEEGEMLLKCSRCEETKTEKIEKLSCTCSRFCFGINPENSCKLCRTNISGCRGGKPMFATPKTTPSLSITLSSTEAATYDGTAKTPPTVTNVAIGDTTLSDYTYTWTDSDGNNADFVNAGIYTITVTVKDTGEYEGKTGTATFTIAKADPLETDPAAKTGLGYNGKAQALVSAGKVKGGTLQYSLDGTTYSTDIPKGTDATEYTVYYKVVGDANHNDTDAAELKVTIAKATPTVEAPVAKTGLGYNGKAQALVTAGKTTGGTLLYSLDGKTYSASVPTGTASGDYKVYYKVQGNNNYNDVTVQGPINVSIATSAAETVAKMISDLGWLPGDQVDPGNKHQRKAVLTVWNEYHKLSATERAKVPADLVDWLYYLVGNTDYAIIGGNGGYWYEGRKEGLSISAIDPHHKFGAVYVDGKLIDSSNYTYYWYGVNEYGEEDIVVVTLKPAYLSKLKLGGHDISISFTNGYAPGYFYIVDAASSPRTGDTANTPLWAGLMLLSMAALGTTGFMLRKKKET